MYEDLGVESVRPHEYEQELGGDCRYEGKGSENNERPLISTRKGTTKRRAPDVR